MQNTQLKIKGSPTDLWLMGYVAGVLAYAKTDPDFASSLAHQIQARKWKPLITQTPLKNSSHLTPTTRTKAITTANWLLNDLDTRTDARISRSTLTTWAKDFESPKDLLFGIIGLAVIGPTLGLISSKKKRRSHLQIVIDEKTYGSLTKLEVTKTSQKLSMEVLAKELRLVGGNVFNLHPDTAEWCLAEPATKIFTDTRSGLSELAAAAKAEGLSHSVAHNKKGKLIAIALSPSVNDSFVDESEAKKCS